MVELETINLLVQILGVSAAAIASVVGVGSYINSNKRAEEAKRKEQETRDRELETRQAQLFMDIYKIHESPEFQTIWWEIIGNWEWTDLDDFLKKYGPYSGNSVPYGKLMSLFSHYEGMSVMMRRGLLSPDLVYEFKYDSIIMFWDKFSPIVQGWRKRYNAPQMFESIEWLYSEMKRIREAKGHGYDYASYMKMPISSEVREMAY
jgi:hypothetical protein